MPNTMSSFVIAAACLAGVAADAHAQFVPESRSGLINLNVANLGPTPGYLSGYSGDEFTASGTTSSDDLIAQDILYYGPDGFDRINNADYFALQDLTISSRRIEIDLMQDSTVAGDASPAIFLSNQAEYFFEVGETVTASVEIAYDGSTNSGNDFVGADVRRVGPGEDPVVLGVLFTAATAPSGSGTVDGEIELIAGERYLINIRGDADQGPVNGSQSSHVRLTLFIPCLPDVNMDGELTPTDFGAWLAAYNADDPKADQNENGMVEPTDFGAWLANYNAGCE